MNRSTIRLQRLRAMREAAERRHENNSLWALGERELVAMESRWQATGVGADKEMSKPQLASPARAQTAQAPRSS
jgi:hypothetical protein